MKRIIVIGAGPAGMAAALEAAHSGSEVIVLDKNSITGRKLRITGAGRGNLTNLNVTPNKYFSHHDAGFVQSVIGKMDSTAMVDYLHELGIFTWHTDDGWVYPVSNSAVNVTALFEVRLIEAGVKLKLGTPVQDILWTPDSIRVITTQGEELQCSRLIIACGGKAYPELGSTGELLTVMKRLGHKVWPIKPALAPVVTDMKSIHKLQGVRLDAVVSLWRKNEMIAETEGNIIFTHWGINGPGVMDVSHWVNEYLQDALFLQIDFLGKYTKDFFVFLKNQRNANLGIGSLFGSVLPPKMVTFLLEQSGIPAGTQISQISDEKLDGLLSLARHLRIDIKGLKGFDQCQVSAGGISLAEVDPLTMHSKRLPGIYFAGEMLDVIGPCGGYNLHWALATGILAGRGVTL